MAYLPPIGSVVAFQSDPTKLQVTASIAGTVQISGNHSVSGTVGASIIGLTPIQVPGSIAVAIIAGSVAVSVTPPANQSVSGIVGASIVGQLPAGGAMIGSIVAYQGVLPWAIAGSVAALVTNTNVNVSGSVVAFVSGTPNVNTAGSVVAFQGTSPWVIGSIVGTYAEDAAHTTADKGLFALGVRNDAVASFVSADLDYTPLGLDSAGRYLSKPFAAEEARVEGYNSVVSTSVTTLIAAAGAGLKNYITDFFIANTGVNTTLITFKDGAGSVLGYTIAPASGGSNAPGLATPIRTGANATFDFQATTASSILYATVKGYKAP